MKQFIYLFCLFIISFSNRALEKQNFIKSTETQKDGSKRVEVDLNLDGKVDRIEIYKDNELISVKLDATYSGHIDEWITYAPYVSSTIPIEVSKKDTNQDGKIDRIESVYRDPEHNLLITTSEVDSKYTGIFDKKWSSISKLSEKRSEIVCNDNLNFDDLKILKLQADVKSVNSVLEKGFCRTDFGYNIHQSCLEKWGADTFPDLLKSSMSKGFQCLAKLAKDNAKSNPTLPNGALNNLRGLEFILQSSGVSITCNEKKYKWTGTAAHASTNPSDKIEDPEMKHPFLSINPNDPKVPPMGTPEERSELAMTLFHEQLHNLGIRHNESIEFPYACETCCIKNDEGDVTKDACKICGGAYTGPTDKNYLTDLITWGKSSYQEERSAKAIIKYQKEFPQDRFGLFAYADASAGIFSPVGIELGKILKQKMAPLSPEETTFINNSQKYSDEVRLINAAPFAKIVAESQITLYYEQDPIKVLDQLSKEKNKIKELIKKEESAKDNYKYIYGDIKKKLDDLIVGIWLNGHPDNSNKIENKRAYDLLKETGLLK